MTSHVPVNNIPNNNILNTFSLSKRLFGLLYKAELAILCLSPPSYWSNDLCGGQHSRNKRGNSSLQFKLSGAVIKSVE